MRPEASLTQYTVSAALCFWERQFGVLSWTVVSGPWDFLKDFCLKVEALGGGHFNKQHPRTSMKTFSSGEPSIF